MNLLAVQLLLRKGNRPMKISTRKHSDASLLLRSSRSGRCYLCRGGRELKQYRRRMQRFSISLPCGPRKQLDAEYEELQRDVESPLMRERPANSWISVETWALVDHRTMLRRKGMLSQTGARSLGRKVKAHLAADRCQRASNTTSKIEGCLAAG